MLFIIISGILLAVLGIIFYVTLNSNRGGILNSIIFISILIMLMAFIIFISYGLETSIGSEMKCYKMQGEYEMLEKSKNNLYAITEIIDYNSEIRFAKKYYNSPWFGIFVVDGFEELPLIDIGEISE